MRSEHTRICTKCGETKDLSNFGKHKTGKGGRRSQCNDCRAAASRARYAAKREEILEKQRIYDRTRRGDRSAYHKKWREENAERKKAADAAYYQANAERIKEGRREYYANNKEEVIEQQKAYRERNPEACQERSRQYRATHKEERNEYERRKLREDIEYRLRHILRSRLNDALRGNQKAGSAVRDLGCTVAELRVCLEEQFYPRPESGEEMTWDNHTTDGWHIDHIEPLVSFDLTDLEQFKRACHFTNLQPLWWEDNLSKATKAA